jgi:hypothetical protein
MSHMLQSALLLLLLLLLLLYLRLSSLNIAYYWFNTFPSEYMVFAMAQT